MVGDDGPDLSCFDFGDSDEGVADTAEETRDQTVKRHRQEEQVLRTAAKERRNTIPKGDRAGRAAEESALESELQHMRERHARQLAADGVDHLVGAAAQLSVSNQPAKQSKGSKRRQKKEESDRVRDRRIAEEKAAAGPSARQIEMQKLVVKLMPLGLQVQEIPADGHCLYRSLAHQMQLDGQSRISFQHCRRDAAAYIRANPSDFLPYLAADTGDASEQSLDKYCGTIEASSEWGGQLEITALAHFHKRCIAVHNADAPVLLTGEDYDANGPRLQLAYHRHYYELGEHYNSLVPAGPPEPQS